jgi:hypothetical protein
MTTIAHVATTMQEILGPVADCAAQATGFVQRTSKLSGAAFVQTLVFGWLAQPQASLAQLAQTAATVGVAITPQGLDARFSPAAAECLREVLERAVRAVITADPVAIPVLRRFTQVAVQDCTIISLPAVLGATWPGCGGRTPTSGAAALKLSVQLDLLHGTLTGPYLETGRTNDRATTLAQVELPAGSLRLTDLGFFSTTNLAALDAQQVAWLSPLQRDTAIYTTDGRRWDLLALLESRCATTLDLSVRLGVRQRVGARVLAARVPRAAAERRRRRLLAEAQRKGETVSPTTLALCAWTVVVTNLPATQLTLEEALVLAHIRWQIELLFKLWKSHNRLDEWRTGKPWRILCEVYAKLLAVIVQHWLTLVGCWQRPDRSLVQAAHLLQLHALSLAAAIGVYDHLYRLIHRLVPILTTTCRITRRRAAPVTFQALLALEAEALA